MSMLDDADVLHAARMRELMTGYYEAAFRAIRVARRYDGPSDPRVRDCLGAVRRYRRIIRALRGTLFEPDPEEHDDYQGADCE